jgi:hypothetical protein
MGNDPTPSNYPSNPVIDASAPIVQLWVDFTLLVVSILDIFG